MYIYIYIYSWSDWHMLDLVFLQPIQRYTLTLILSPRESMLCGFFSRGVAVFKLYASRPRAIPD